MNLICFTVLQDFAGCSWQRADPQRGEMFIRTGKKVRRERGGRKGGERKRKQGQVGQRCVFFE